VIALVELARELEGRGISLWLADLPADALALAVRDDRWPQVEERVRLLPSLDAAVSEFDRST
jgi:hypothetical protein